VVVGFDDIVGSFDASSIVVGGGGLNTL